MTTSGESIRIPLFDMLMCLSGAIDLVSPSLSNHNRQVAYIASCIAVESGLTDEAVGDIIIAGALHDIGALSLKERLSLLSFEVDNVQRHSELGYRHIASFAPFSHVSPVIRYHHTHFDAMDWHKDADEADLRASNIIHIADRISILVDRREEILRQVPFIVETVSSGSGTLFMPSLVEAFKRLAGREWFWLSINNRAMERYLLSHMGSRNIDLDADSLLDFARLFGRVIDFRSSFTAIHSRRVAIVAKALAGFTGMSAAQCAHMEIAGLLHDLGKLAVSTEILDKPGPLTRDEWNIMRSHPFHTYHLLTAMTGMEQIGQWASRHHERVDGKGYPFHLPGDSLGTGDRVLAVADIYTALTEERPYRAGLPRDEAFRIIDSLAADSAVDPDIAATARRHAGDLDELRMIAEKTVALEYREFTSEIRE